MQPLREVGTDATAARCRLGVVARLVVDAAGGWAADGGVVPVMVVAVEPGVKGAGSAGV